MEEQNRILAYQAIDENLKDSTAREICKWVFEMEVNGSETICPSNKYFAQKFGWTLKTTEVAVSRAKKSGFIATTGRGKSRTFELNVQFLKGKMAEILVKRPIRRVLDLEDLNIEPKDLPKELPKDLPKVLPKVLPKDLPKFLGQNNRGENAPNSNSNSNSKNKSKNIIKKIGKKNSEKRFVKPTVKEIEEYCQEKGYSIDAEYFFEYYESVNWRNKNGPVKSWKQTLVTWNRNQLKWEKEKEKSPAKKEKENLDFS